MTTIPLWRDMTRFLSTLSLRRATAWSNVPGPIPPYFYPRSPCGERHNPRSRKQPHPNFYPRSPCGERRLEFCDTAQHTYFYPRSPCGERPYYGQHPTYTYQFLSTLSLRRATKCQPASCALMWYFYPRSPCGERPRRAGITVTGDLFLSTLSLRRATSML